MRDIYKDAWAMAKDLKKIERLFTDKSIEQRFLMSAKRSYKIKKKKQFKRRKK